MNGRKGEIIYLVYLFLKLKELIYSIFFLDLVYSIKGIGNMNFNVL